MKNVTILAQSEAVRVDADKLEALYAQLGDVSAEDIVCRAMEELAVKLAQSERLYREGRRADMHKTARSIAAISEQIGMLMLARVAKQVTECIESGDEIALAAVLARLVRIGERSLTEIWELQDLSI
ncbi:hypothetical protein N4R57_19255 [Rhodobacteraceae bacterium D3-12]|nr:hypothetical protein N4R57_19255 [Rhodobacteraceae bacterium D3-12]